MKQQANLTIDGETFENVYGIYLDKGTSLFVMMGNVSAAGSAHHLPRRSRM